MSSYGVCKDNAVHKRKEGMSLAIELETIKVAFQISACIRTLIALIVCTCNVNHLAMTATNVTASAQAL